MILKFRVCMRGVFSTEKEGLQGGRGVGLQPRYEAVVRLTRSKHDHDNQPALVIRP
jgi:hypothetical protein